MNRGMPPRRANALAGTKALMASELVRLAAAGRAWMAEGRIVARDRTATGDPELDAAQHPHPGWPRWRGAPCGYSRGRRSCGGFGHH